MYVATTGLFERQVFPPYFFIIDCLLTILLLMNLYWFILIVLFSVRVLTGDLTELDDTREYDVAQKLDTSKRGVVIANGKASSSAKLEKNGNGCHNGAATWQATHSGDSGAAVRERHVGMAATES